MKKLFLFLLLFVATSYGQYNPYNISGWDAPYTFTGQPLAKPPWSLSYGYYNLGIFTIGSNPGGWLNRNFWAIDSLMQSLVVYTDTTQFKIVNDTLQFSEVVAAKLDTNFSIYASVDTLQFQILNDTLMLSNILTSTIASNAPYITSIDTTQFVVTGGKLTLKYIFGALSWIDGTYVLPLDQNVGKKISNATNTLYVLDASSSSSIVEVGDSIRIDQTGMYTIDVSLSFQGGVSGVYKAYIKHNNTILPYKSTRSTSGSDTGNMGFQAIVTIISGDFISLWVVNTGSATDYTAVSGTIIIEQVQ